MQIENIDNLSLNDKIYLMEELWNSICNSIEAPSWHKDILKSREKIENKNSKFYTIEELEKLK